MKTIFNVLSSYPFNVVTEKDINIALIVIWAGLIYDMMK